MWHYFTFKLVNKEKNTKFKAFRRTKIITRFTNIPNYCSKFVAKYLTQTPPLGSWLSREIIKKQFNLFNHVVKNKNQHDVTYETDSMLRLNALAKTVQSVQSRC